MYENFKVPSNVSIAGYRWDVENAKQVVCLIHGIGEHIGRYDRMAQMMNAEDIAVFGMDHRGHGLSEGTRGHAAPRAEVMQDIDTLLTIIETEYPNVPIVVYGHSMGGNVTLDYRIRGRLAEVPAAYIVTGPWIKLYKPFPAPVVKLAKILSKIKPEFKVTSAIDESKLGHESLVVGKYASDPLVHDKITALCASDCMAVGDSLYDGMHGQGKKPLLLMHGTEDMICSVEATRKYAASAENCEYIEWPGYYHEIHNGGAEATGEEVIKTAIAYIKRF
ncbi:MAG: lysophospholipase [Firmicutes bacterium]|nr:lysophospholipase [Bacillota bacterium]